MIGFGIVAGLLDGIASWLAYLAGVFAYLGLLYLLLRTLPQQASLHTDRVRAVFTTLRNLTVVLWTIYPVVSVLGPLGLGVVQYTDEVLVVAYLDLISKMGFVIMALNGRDALVDLESTDVSAPNDRGKSKGKDRSPDPDHAETHSPSEPSVAEPPDRRPPASSASADPDNAD